MKKLSTTIIAIIFMLSGNSAMAQDVETSATKDQEVIAEETQPNYEAEEPIENMNVEELKALEKESKSKEKAALKEAKQAKKLEKQIQKTKNAEARAKKQGR